MGRTGFKICPVLPLRPRLLLSCFGQNWSQYKPNFVSFSIASTQKAFGDQIFQNPWTLVSLTSTCKTLHTVFAAHSFFLFVTVNFVDLYKSKLDSQTTAQLSVKKKLHLKINSNSDFKNQVWYSISDYTACFFVFCFLFHFSQVNKYVQGFRKNRGYWCKLLLYVKNH